MEGARGENKTKEPRMPPGLSCVRIAASRFFHHSPILKAGHSLSVTPVVHKDGIGPSIRHDRERTSTILGGK